LFQARVSLAPIAVASLAAALAALPAASQAPADHHHEFEDAERWARVFDDPKRDEWQKPHEVIEALALKSDAIVADVGAGTGYFSVRLARMLPGAKIYAADIEPAMVQHLAARAKRDGLPNMHAVQSALDDARLPEKVDLVLFVDVYHHIDDRSRYFGRLKESLKPGGRVAVIDFTLDSDVGPPPRARVSPERVRSELARAGYKLADDLTFLPNQYFLIFSAAE
jgi:SAM-dependent methyltransferase